MATYTVIQDIEAEDKLVGPLTLRQFIYAGIAALCLYLSFLFVTKHVPFLVAFTLPIAGVCGFFAFPWGQDQPTEVWALAKIRFLLKPRRRIWDQSGAKELVTVTVPRVIERHLTNGLNQEEVHSRLNALASTIDSRGWAVKNVNVNLDGTMPVIDTISDRLVSASNFPQEVSNIDVRASDDILDASANPIAQHFDNMITAASNAHRQQLMAQLQQPAAPAPAPTSPAQTSQAPTPAADYWFMHQGPTTTAPGQATFVDSTVVSPGAAPAPSLPVAAAAIPTAEEEAMIARFKEENKSQTVAYGNMKTLKTPEQLAEEDATRRAAEATAKAEAEAKAHVTPVKQAAIMNFASNDDLDVATIARQAQKAQENDGEVVISLH